MNSATHVKNLASRRFLAYLPPNGRFVDRNETVVVSGELSTILRLAGNANLLSAYELDESNDLIDVKFNFGGHVVTGVGSPVGSSDVVTKGYVDAIVMPDGDFLLNSNNLSDVADVPTARINLGLGSASVYDVGFDPNDIVQLNGSGALPALDGNLIYNLNGANIQAASVVAAALAPDVNTVYVPYSGATADVNLGLHSLTLAGSANRFGSVYLEDSVDTIMTSTGAHQKVLVLQFDGAVQATDIFQVQNYNPGGGTEDTVFWIGADGSCGGAFFFGDGSNLLNLSSAHIADGGANLTTIPVSALQSGLIPAGVDGSSLSFSFGYPSADGSLITGINPGNIVGGTFNYSIDASNLYNLYASNMQSGGSFPAIEAGDLFNLSAANLVGMMASVDMTNAYNLDSARLVNISGPFPSSCLDQTIISLADRQLIGGGGFSTLDWNACILTGNFGTVVDWFNSVLYGYNGSTQAVLEWSGSNAYSSAPYWFDSTDSFKFVGDSSRMTTSIQTVIAAYTMLPGDSTILVDASHAAFSVTLPPALSGKVCVVKKIDSSENVVSVVGAGGELIDDLSTQTISAQYTSITFQSDGTAWWII